MLWPRELARQLTHPLALLLWVAALLSLIVGSITVGVAVVLIIVLNAAVAFVQERHAENAVEALGRGVQQPLPAVGDRGRARDRRRVRVHVSGAAWHRRSAGRDLLLLIPFPFIVWGADELRKWVIRTWSSRRAQAVTPAPAA